MNPLDIFEYKMKWMPGYDITFNFDYLNKAEKWCNDNLEKHQWKLTRWTNIFDHCMHFEHLEHASQFEKYMKGNQEVNDMKNYITAEDARMLSGPTAEEYVEAACNKIKKSAEEGKRMVVLVGDFWVQDAYKNTEKYQQVKNILEKELGFTVKFFYEERQFVNMYTIVEW